jgi:tRNA1(Val) A37 N6-methylase TrmN6
MSFRIAEARKDLQAFDLKKLFVEQMGWDNPGADLVIRFNGQNVKLKAIAQKRGLGAFVVPPVDGKLPDYASRRKIEVEVRKSVHEHILIFTDAQERIQKWQWVRREAGKPTTAREFEFSKGTSGDVLLQRLEKIYFSLADEEQIDGVTYAASRVRSAFDVEKVTKKFYERFKDEHAAFMKFIKGIPDKEMQRWYVSVTLNRLMFVYFIQSKHFLDNDPEYLKHQLELSKTRGKDLFYTDFLCPLFFDGFAKKKHSAETKKLLGNIPYLNGGIFEKHKIEKLYGQKIEIPDKAFDQLFAFFSQYHWHLDERALRGGNEINPDVLGYIFEKYVNQKQMGAYYTKEDITEYNSKYTIIPHLFDVAQRLCSIAFDGEGSVWRHLRNDPDRYIFAAVRFGAEMDLPQEIAVGVDDPNQRGAWNKPAPAEFALPTEIWREVIARRGRYQEVREKLARGEITSINDLITLNLDIRQFAQDVIADSDADLLAAFWKALTQIKILDPTVGSGAFLFAALNVLEPLYEVCLERMSALVEELDRSGEKHSPKKYEPFRKALEQVRQRPDEDYFIFKSIIVNNLYGVDIMEEAVEICKLRLFLKLASQVEADPTKENLGIEPLPDIDFNIRAGNTLVGFATRADVQRSVQFGTVDGVQTEKLFAMDDEKSQLNLIQEKAEEVDRLYKLFRQQQTEFGGEVNADDKNQLQKKLQVLNDELNVLLARQYGIDKPKGNEYKKWLESHKPFHWLIEFYGIMNEGGFDVIVGNPPYVEYAKVKKEYTVQNYETESCGNLYAFTYELVVKILQKHGRSGLIIPVASVCTDGYLPLRKIWQNAGNLVISTFNDRPGKLFDGLEHIRLAIVLLEKSTNKEHSVHTTKYYRWQTIERPNLFAQLTYEQATNFVTENTISKVSNKLELSVLSKILSQTKTLGHYARPSTKYKIYYTRKLSAFVQILDFVPQIYDAKGNEREPSELKEICFEKEAERNIFLALLNSNLFYWLMTAQSDCRNLNKREVYSARLDVKKVDPDVTNSLIKLSQKLMKELQQTSKLLEMNYEGLGTMKIQCTYPKFSKSTIDEIDRALARHYGLTAEELDFIINYDVKYRMGAELEDGDE